VLAGLVLLYPLSFLFAGCAGGGLTASTCALGYHADTRRRRLRGQEAVGARLWARAESFAYARGSDAAALRLLRERQRHADFLEAALRGKYVSRCGVLRPQASLRGVTRLYDASNSFLRPVELASEWLQQAVSPRWYLMPHVDQAPCWGPPPRPRASMRAPDLTPDLVCGVGYVVAGVLALGGASYGL